MAEKLLVRKEESGFYEPYAHFSRTLRGWFVAYGIGGPILMMSQDLFATAVQNSGNGRFIAACFLTGLGLQIIEALGQKYSMAVFYESELNSAVIGKWHYRLAAWFTDQYIISLTFDLATLGLYVVGTYLAMGAIII